MAKINPHNHKVIEHSFSKGVNDSLQPEISTNQEGYYYDGSNVRVTSVDGETTAVAKVSGEEVLISIPELVGATWTSLWFGVVRGRYVSIWAHDTGAEDSAVSVDGEVVLQSANFPMTLASKLQVAVDESCSNGELFCTDNIVAPYFLSVEDMLQSKAEGSEKYFADFVFENYSINFDSPVDHPIIIGLADVGTGNGRPVGKCSYMIRFVDADGNEANPSYPTPLVFIPRNYLSGSSYETLPQNDHFPSVKHYGADADVTFNTAYSPVIKFRVTNLVGWSSIQLIRSSWDTGAGFGYTPVKEIIKTFDISSTEIGIIEYVDSLSNQDTPITLTLDEITGDALQIERAKAVRYFDRRVELGNINYTKLNEGDISFIQSGGENYMFPVTQPLGIMGHADVVREAYQKTLMHNEKYSYGLLGLPSNLQKLFVVPILDNVEVPSRRAEVTGDSLTYSEDAVVAANTYGSVSETLEIFDLETASQPSDDSPGWNIRDDTGIGYRVHKPINIPDLSQDFNFKRVERYYFDESASSSFGWAPDGFKPTWHATGMALAGLDTYPDWLKAFSIVRRERPGRVVVQGLATYSLFEGGQATSACGKYGNEFWFFSPDLDNGVLDASIVSQLENAQSGDFKVEMVSPLGFFSEVYNAHEHGGGGDNDSHIDMVAYARVLRDKLSDGMNTEFAGDNYPGIDDGTTSHLILGYPAYGKWRNPSANPEYPANANGTKLWTIDSVDKEILAEGIPRWKVTLTEDLYVTGTSGKSFKDNTAKEFHEPWYIVNIILEGVENPESNVQDYQPSEHYQKIDAIVGKANGSNIEQFELVDERWEDFHTEGAGVHAVTKQVYIDEGDGIPRRYVNVNVLSVGDIADVDADILAGGGTTFDGVPVWGKFGSTRTSILFGSASATTYTTLSVGALIHVMYDNRFPCISYGDAVVGDGLGVKIHNKKSSANSWDADNDFRLNCAYPYFRWDKPDGFHYCRRTTSGSFSVLEPDSPGHVYSLSRVRQMVVVYPVTSYSLVPLAYSEHFPLVNYVMRPNRFDASLSPADQEIYPFYENDYPLENDRWLYGGFRLKQAPINVDYSQGQTSPALFSRPAVGFLDNTEFCTRVIWSLTRPINVSYYPGLRTFPINHAYDLDDRRGQINFLFDSISGGVRNLYAFTEDDIALLVTNNQQLNTLDGQQLAIIGDTGTTGFIYKDIFLGLQGMPGSVWCTAAEDENGIFFLNRDSIYYFEAGKLKDIGRPFYRATLWNEFVERAINGDIQDWLGVFDTKHREYWLGVGDGTYNNLQTLTAIPNTDPIPVVSHATFIADYTCMTVDNGRGYADLGINALPGYPGANTCLCNVSSAYINLYEYVGSVQGKLIGQIPPNWCGRLTFQNMIWVLVEDKTCDTCSISYDRKMINFGTQIDNWQGAIGYRFDKMASKDSRTYGARGGQIFEVHVGSQINGADIASTLRIQVSPEGAFFKEFVRVRLGSSRAPTRIRVYDSTWSTVVNQIELADLRDYGSGYEQYIPRNLFTDNRIQGNVLRLEIFDEESQELALRLLNVQYKLIK